MSESGVIPPPEDRIPGLPFAIGSVVDVNGQRLNVGVVDDLVVIGPFHTILTVRLNREQREEFSRLYFEAERQAAMAMCSLPEPCHQDGCPACYGGDDE